MKAHNHREGRRHTAAAVKREGESIDARFTKYNLYSLSAGSDTFFYILYAVLCCLKILLIDCQFQNYIIN